MELKNLKISNGGYVVNFIKDGKEKYSMIPSEKIRSVLDKSSQNETPSDLIFENIEELNKHIEKNDIKIIAEIYLSSYCFNHG